MTREELEKEIAKRLGEIQDLIEAFDPSVVRANLTCAPDYVSAFALHHDKNQQPITGQYHFDVAEFKKEGNDSERMAG